MGFAQKGGRAIAVIMASAKKVRRQKILKIFLPECFCRTERCCAVAFVRSRQSKRNAFCLRGIVYGECPPLCAITVEAICSKGLRATIMSIDTEV